MALREPEVVARELLVRLAHFHYWSPVSNPDSWLAWGLPRPLIRDLFDAAATFHRVRPWRILDDVPPLMIQLAEDRIWTAAVQTAR